MRFLTVVPWGRWDDTQPEDLGCAAMLFPWVGALLGLAVAGARQGILALGGSPALAAALALTLWVLLTGGLHLDGLMDAADGLLGGTTAAQRLEIMRDERVGAFGALAAMLVLLVKYVALQTAPLPAVVYAPVLGRWTLTVAMAAFPYARPQGLGRMWFTQVGWKTAGVASLTVAWMAWALAWPGAWLVWGSAALLAWLLALWALRRVPGLTGDLYGALAELTETVALVLSIWAP